MSISYIRRFIFSLPRNRIFTTREILPYSSRSIVDQSLRRLVQSGVIERLARGVFIREGSNRPSAFEVAKAKCQAFGKQIAQHGSQLAAELGLVDNKNQQTIFTTAGRSSSFWFGNILIKIRGISHRKMKLNEHKAGKYMAALWYMGKSLCQLDLVAQITQRFFRTDRQQLRLSSSLIPGWLDNFFDKSRYPKFIEIQKRNKPADCDGSFEIELQNQCDVFRDLEIDNSFR